MWRDGRVLHLRQDLAFDLEMGELARVQAVPAQQFERHRAVHRLELVGAVDLAHAAAPEQGLDAVAADALARRQGVGGRCRTVRASGVEALGGRGVIAGSWSVHRPTPCRSGHSLARLHSVAMSRPPDHDRTDRDDERDTTQRTELSAGPRRSGLHSACVVVIHGEGLGKRVDVDEKPIIVGRSQECDLHIPHPSVSRQHCSIWRDAEGYRVRDLGSTNRTRVNEQRIDGAMLADGDHITVGETILKFISHASVEARYHEEVYQLATHDALTELCNRRHFLELLDKEIARAERHGRPLALAIVDVDHFKRVNDEHGHIAGDGVLKQIAEVLRAHVRGEDIAARIGGEEFAVLLPEETPAAARAFGRTPARGHRGRSLRTRRRAAPHDGEHRPGRSVRHARHAQRADARRRRSAVRGQGRRPQPGLRRGVTPCIRMPN